MHEDYTASILTLHFGKLWVSQLPPEFPPQPFSTRRPTMFAPATESGIAASPICV